MLSDKFKIWVRDTYKHLTHKGSVQSKKYRVGDEVVEEDKLVDSVMNRYRDLLANNKVEDFGNVTTITPSSADGKELLNYLKQLARNNKKSVAAQEKERREYNIAGSMNDKWVRMAISIPNTNDKDLELINQFCLATVGTAYQVYYTGDPKDPEKETTYELLGFLNANDPQLINKMCKRVKVDLLANYETFEKMLSNTYSDLRVLDVPEVYEWCDTTKPFYEWEEVRALPIKDADTVITACATHIIKNNVHALPLARGTISLYKIVSSRWDEAEDKAHTWVSGFKFSASKDKLIDFKTYCQDMLNEYQFMPLIDMPVRFGGIYSLHNDPTGRVVNYKDNPILRSYFYRTNETQLKVLSAFWYCVVHRIPTPSLLDMNYGGSGKNTIVELVIEYASKMWECPEDSVMFKLQGSALKDNAKLTLAVNGVVYTYLDFLFAFYDEMVPSKEMWNTFKMLVGSTKPRLTVRKLYVDEFTVTGDPVPMYMAINHPIQIYDKHALYRRLVVIRTDAKNSYLEAMSPQELVILNGKDSPERTRYREEAFATLMSMGKAAYEEIEQLGGMININGIFPELASVFNNYADDFDNAVAEFYDGLFKAGEDTYSEKGSKLFAMYSKFADEEVDKSLETRLGATLLGMHIDNKKIRVTEGNHKTTKYILHRVQRETTESPKCA